MNEKFKVCCSVPCPVPTSVLSKSVSIRSVPVSSVSFRSGPVCCNSFPIRSVSISFDPVRSFMTLPVPFRHDSISFLFRSYPTRSVPIPPFRTPSVPIRCNVIQSDIILINDLLVLYRGDSPL